MNRPDNLFDILQMAKDKAFKEFLANLSLKHLKFSVVYSQGRKSCHLGIQNPRIPEPSSLD
jgi:hypothetical protein